MRTLVLALSPIPALTLAAELAAQAVERTDVPRRGDLRITFDPRIVTWESQLTAAGGRERLGAPLTGDTVSGTYVPAVARLEQDIRTASGVSGFVASLGKGLFSVRQERRILPVTAELGVTDHLSLGVTVPIVRIETRARLQLSPAGATLGPNPLATVPGADAQYASFFTQFDTTLARLDANIASGTYGCPASPQCTQAQALSAQGHTVRDALDRSVYGTGGGGSPFLPRDSTDGGRGIDSTIARIQRDLALTYGVTGFTQTFLLAQDSLTTASFTDRLADSASGFGALPFKNRWRYALGDIEIQAKYRIQAGSHYSAAAAAVVRLPTGRQDSTDDLLSLPAGDHQTDLEARLIQELIIGSRLWLNLALRAGAQRPGTRARRVAPAFAFLVPAQAAATLRWDPGDYVAADFAPLYRFAPQFAAGVTVGYWSRRRDHYSFLTAQDSIDLATRLGVPTPASVLDAGTSERWLRLGAAMTYVGPRFEAGFSVEQTVSGAGGRVPAATVFRIVMRTSRRLF